MYCSSRSVAQKVRKTDIYGRLENLDDSFPPMVLEGIYSDSLGFLVQHCHSRTEIGIRLDRLAVSAAELPHECIERKPIARAVGDRQRYRRGSRPHAESEPVPQLGIGVVVAIVGFVGVVGVAGVAGVAGEFDCVTWDVAVRRQSADRSV